MQISFWGIQKENPTNQPSVSGSNLWTCIASLQLPSLSLACSPLPAQVQGLVQVNQEGSLVTAKRTNLPPLQRVQSLWEAPAAGTEPGTGYRRVLAAC